MSLEVFILFKIESFACGFKSLLLISIALNCHALAQVGGGHMMSRRHIVLPEQKEF